MREKLLNSYVTTLSRYLSITKGGNPDDYVEQLKSLVMERIKIPELDYIDTTSYGNPEYKKTSAIAFIDDNRDNIITPSGSVYLPTDKKVSFISQMVIDKLADRKKYKKKMLAAQAAGDKTEEMRCHYRQATIKINCNSLPGGFGSAFNLFYDKGGYNAITSLARSLIAYACLGTEQVLNGNFSFFCEDRVVNFITTHLGVVPDERIITKLVQTFNLKVPTKEDLINSYLNTINNYNITEKIPRVEKLINSLYQHEITWLFYYSNYHNLIIGNINIFGPWIDKTFNFDMFGVSEGGDPSEIKDLKEETIIMLSTILNESLDGAQINGSIDPANDICKLNPQLAGKIAKFGKWIEMRISGLTQLFETFIYLKMPIQNVSDAHIVWRRAVILSDTDSDIFTMLEWVKKYTNSTNTSLEAYKICSLCIYLLTISMRYYMDVFGSVHGASKDKLKMLCMKNEFFYPTMLRYDVKKTYAGIVSIQEGVVLPKPKPDIKGQLLRGSSFCTTTTDFIQKLLVDKILKPSMNGQISANQLIRDVVDFENEIKRSLKAGETTFLKITSVRNESDYVDADRTAHYYYKLWQEVFAEKYGDIRIPSKTPLIQLLYPNKEMLNRLKSLDPSIHDKLVNFIEVNKRISSIVINPVLTQFPIELAPLINVRDIVYHNVSSIYMILEAIGINVGYSNDKLLLSDIYSFKQQP